MCWYSGRKINLKIADKDIPVFKIVRSKAHISLYYHAIYSENNTYKSEIIIGEDNYKNTMVNKALHSYLSDSVSILITNSPGGIVMSYPTLQVIYKGVITLDSIQYKDYLYLMKCIVPKGSIYDINEQGEVISDTLKVISFEQFNY